METSDVTVEWVDFPNGARRCQATAIVDKRKVAVVPSVTITAQQYADAPKAGWSREQLEKDVEDSVRFFVKNMFGG